MLVTDDEEWANRARHLTTQAKADPVEYIHDEIGYNYRLTNIQAAMGCAQMEMIDQYIEAKRRIAASYSEQLANLPGLQSMVQAPWAESVFWLFSVLVDETKYGINSRQLLSQLGEAGIQTRPLCQPMHLSPAYVDLHPAGCPVSDWLFQKGLSLPCSVGLGESQSRVISALKRLSSETQQA